MADKIWRFWEKESGVRDRVIVKRRERGGYEMQRKRERGGGET